LEEQSLDLIKRLIDRLEHLSVDSTYAHRASGMRGSLLRYIQRLETGDPMDRDDQVDLDALVEDGFEILTRAAKEIGAAK
jgi:hypothetical protein